MGVIDGGVARLMASIEELGQKAEGRHEICGDRECVSCRSVIAQAGRVGKDRLLAIPGVQAAIAFNEAMKERGQDIGWNDVQKSYEAAETYRVMNTPVTPDMEDVLNKAFHPSGVEEFNVDHFIRDFQKDFQRRNGP